jgi:fructokinase
VTWQICSIGEILWDVFPDGARFGGAPANFACSLSELSSRTASVHLVSAVGNDELGEQAVQELARHGVLTEWVQRNAFETGRVDVHLDSAGVASYRFAADSAWDHLQWDAGLERVAAASDLICFGTLGQRSVESRATIRRWLQTVPEQTVKILDINLRRPFDERDVVMESLPLANVLKLNEDELRVLAGWTDSDGADLEILDGWRSRFGLKWIALTRGGAGSVLMGEAGVSELAGDAVEVIDTVGAGDAFTAALALGLLRGDSLESMHRTANAAAAYACTQPGGTMTFPTHLQMTHRPR